MYTHPNGQSSSGQAPSRENHNPQAEAGKYRRWVLRARVTTGHFVFCRSFYAILKNKLDALFLQDLINLASLDRTTRDGDWFMCSTEYLDRSSWSRREQVARITSLIGTGFLACEHRPTATGRVRWLSIDIEAIETALDEAEGRGDCGVQPNTDPGGGSTPNGTMGQHQTGRKEVIDSSTKNLLPSKRGSGSPKAHRSPPEHLSTNHPNNRRKKKGSDVVLSDLVNSNQTNPAPKTEEVDFLRCQRLRRIVNSRRWFCSSAKKKWEPQLAALRRRLGDRHQEIDAVLEWYEEQKTPRPQIKNGTDLNRCWDWLYDSYKQANPGSATPASPEAVRIAEWVVQHVEWPVQKSLELPAAAQKSLDFLRSFGKALAAVTDRKLSRAANLLLQLHLNDPVHFTRRWFESLAAWPALREGRFRGSLDALCPSLDNKQFREMMAAEVNRHFGDGGKVWQRLIEEVSCEGART